MNYRHIYHAGNFADVIKHIVLLLCLDYLQRKEGGLCVIDAHGGAGYYDLASEEAAKTEEWRQGIGRVEAEANPPSDLRHYIDRVKDDLARQHYPGSPLLIARQLRPQDRLISAELHPPAFEALNAAVAPFQNARALPIDAYECICAHIPPRERRGLALIDPPFERKDEFKILERQMREWKKRWATGVYLVWYPIKAHLPVTELKEAAAALAFKRTWAVEILIQPRNQPVGLNGCGLILFNAPFTVPERVETLFPVLRNVLQLHGVEALWLTAA